MVLSLGSSGRSSLIARSANWRLAGSMGLVLVGLAWMSPVHAADDAASKAAARDLAIDGIKLAQSNQCADALPKLEKAEQLYHAPSILTWVGECQIRVGRLVDGTETLNRVVREQLATDAPAAYREAQERAKTLLDDAVPKIAKLTLEVSPANLSGLELRVNGALVPTAMVGAPRPTDPGEVEVEASAPGYFPTKLTIHLEPGQRKTEKLTLVVDPDAATKPAAPTDQSTPAAKESGSNGTLTTVGWISLGTGAALLAAGGVTGGMALGDKGSLDCPGNVCSSNTDIETLDRANTLATLSTAFFIAGGVLGGAGITMLVWPSGDTEKSVAIGPSSLTFRSTF